MEKNYFRIQQKSVLVNFAQSSEKQEEDKILEDKLLQSDILKSSQKIGITISLPIEVNTINIITKLWQMDKKVYIPRCLPQRQMEFTKYVADTDLKKMSFGTFENWNKDADIDNNLDLIVIPGLAFGKEDHMRLGFGGGYYDRFLEKHHLHTVALANSKQLISKAEWKVEKHDIPVDKIITTD